jgi:hypothetical protein
VETWILVQLGKRHSTSLQIRGWHLHHSPIDTMDCMDILIRMGCRGDSPTFTNRIPHLLHCLPLLPSGDTCPFPHVCQTGHVSLLDKWMLCSMLYRTLASHWLGKGFLLQLSHGHKRGIVPFCDVN